MLKYILIGAIIVVAIVLLRRLFGRKPIKHLQPATAEDDPKDGGTVTAEIGDQELEIDAEVLDEARRLADSGQKIEAIKHLREATGLGLAEAKENRRTRSTGSNRESLKAFLRAPLVDPRRIPR